MRQSEATSWNPVLKGNASDSKENSIWTELYSLSNKHMTTPRQFY